MNVKKRLYTQKTSRTYATPKQLFNHFAKNRIKQNQELLEQPLNLESININP